MLKKVLLPTAHPDDESHFFSPAVHALLPEYEVFIVSLSSGNAEGQRDIRLAEFQKAATTWEARHIVCQADLPDGDRRWTPTEIQRALDREEYEAGPFSKEVQLTQAFQPAKIRHNPHLR